MERDELRTTLVNHLETLRRNLQVVSMEVLKTKYKKPFDVLRQDICKAATAYTRFLVFDGMRIKHKYFDEAVPYIDAAVKQTKRLKQISDAAFQRQDIDEIESLALALRKEIEAALQPFYMGHMCLYVTPECFDDPPKTPEIYNDATACVWRMVHGNSWRIPAKVPALCPIQIQGGICRMKETSQRYLNSEAHGYLMEAKAISFCSKTWSASAPSSGGTSKRKPQTARQNLKRPCNTIAKATSRKPTAGNSSVNSSMSTIWNCSVKVAGHLMNTAPLLQNWLSPS